MPTFKRTIQFLVLILIALSMISCLTCERKEYIFQLTGVNSGKLTIKYVNIFSSLIDSTGELTADYDEMINLWLKGKKLERDFPQAKKFRKRLFKENGVLCGEVTMEFDNLSKVNIYRYKGQGPFMFSMSGVNDDGETFAKCNGRFGGEKMPVIFWSEGLRTLKFSTNIATPDSTCVSMLPMWQKNKR